jgi:hypothetical protein
MPRKRRTGRYNTRDAPYKGSLGEADRKLRQEKPPVTVSKPRSNEEREERQRRIMQDSAKRTSRGVGKAVAAASKPRRRLRKGRTTAQAMLGMLAPKRKRAKKLGK